jgi:ribosomal protein L21E
LEEYRIPANRAPRADLLRETKVGEMVHIELQSSNSKNMAIRMLEYGLAALRKHRRYPTQVCLYVGEKPAALWERANWLGMRFSGNAPCALRP